MKTPNAFKCVGNAGGLSPLGSAASAAFATLMIVPQLVHGQAAEQAPQANRPQVTSQSPVAGSDRSGAATATAAGDYERMIGTALEEYNLGNFAEAYAMFEQAHLLRPSARTYRGLGLTSFELHQYVRARGQLEAALDSTQQQLTAAQRAQVQGLLPRIDRYVGRLQIDVRPVQAHVELDGHPVARSISADLGRHELNANADGYQPLLRVIEVAGGTTTRVQLELTPIESSSPALRGPGASLFAPRAPTTNARKDIDHGADGAIFDRWWFWPGVATVAVAGVIVAAVVVSSKPATKPLEIGDVGPLIVGLHL